MGTNFRSDWARALDSAAANDGVQVITDQRAEVEQIIKTVVEDMAQVLGSPQAVDVQPWFTTNEGEGRKIILRMKDGYEIRVLALSIPFSGYPVTIRLDDQNIQAGRSDFKHELQNALRAKGILGLAKEVRDSWR